MQQARKFAPVDEFDREYKSLQRPADAVAKNDRSLQLSDTLREPSLDDDRKVREYVAGLQRYLNVGKEGPRESTPKVNPLTEPLPPQPPPPARNESSSSSPCQTASQTRKRRKRRLLVTLLIWRLSTSTCARPAVLVAYSGRS